jgi:asparagine synthase (glutamine-hydrolysing)
MSGVFGFVGGGTPAVAAAMARRSDAQGDFGLSDADVGTAFGAAGAEGLAHRLERDGRTLALFGHPFISHEERRVTAIHDVAALLFDRLDQEGRGALATLEGDFALAYGDAKRDYALLAVDRMGIRDVVYATAHGTIAFGPDCDTVACHPSIATEVDPQQLYNYLYFHMVPGPATIYRGMQRILPGHCVEFRDGRVQVHRYWRMPFHERRGASFADLRQQFVGALDAAVATYDQPGATGAFLSGGTDSSTVCGLMARQERRPIDAFSIGFDATGYDEMEYARIAASHFGVAHHAYYVTPADVAGAVPRIAAAYDQPFGNASAVPTYFCADLARQQGIARLLAGDGGDELFGGNARYAKQRQFAYYDRVPGVLRQQLLEPVARRLPAASPLKLHKVRSYIEQASMPMPDRYESYNLLDRVGAESILTRDFLDSVDRVAPLTRQRDVYADTNATSLINRMLSFDFQFTLADNDLRKVTRMCELAGVDVAFPMLDDGVVAFSATLPPDMKLRGTTLRYFFKRALADFLPPAIIAKEKHGFGLPFGVWLTKDRQLHDLAADSLAGIRSRGFVRPDFIARLLDRDVASHPGYYGTMVWILMMLEQWYRRERGT